MERVQEMDFKYMIVTDRDKHLLTDTTLSIKEIAFELSYNSTEHFFSIFKRKTRQTPSAYRNHGQAAE